MDILCRRDTVGVLGVLTFSLHEHLLLLLDLGGSSLPSLGEVLVLLLLRHGVSVVRALILAWVWLVVEVLYLEVSLAFHYSKQMG